MNSMSERRISLWTPPVRALIFTLAASSIWCLLAEFYGLCSMRTFTFFVSIPALTILTVLALVDRVRGDRKTWNAILVGTLAGLAAAVAYDLFRIPFVYAKEFGIESIVPHLALYKVFPRFGAMILGEPIEQQSYSFAAQVVGWTYHFSNGLTFGIMYLAMVGDTSRRNWIWAVVMAVGLELAMLFTPYPQMFSISVGAAFVVVTLTAHLIFGVALGLGSRRLARRFV
jgi:hypothetical protein